MNDVLLILQRCALRHWRQSWKQQLMLLMILALGTGVHVAMRLANQSALAGFERFTQSITADADWTIQALAGPMHEDLLREMRQSLGSLPVTLLPMIEATVVPEAPPGQATGEIGSRPTWRMIGMDLIALQNLRTTVLIKANPIKLNASSVFVSKAMAQRQGWQAGTTVRVVANDSVLTLTIVDVIPESVDTPALPDHLLLMDLPALQTLLRRPGEVDRVEVLARNGPAFPRLHEEAGERLRAISKERWQTSAREDRQALAGNMTAAFRLNLDVLSLLALLVGGCLMFQALDGVVIRRREEIAVLRSLGVRQGTVQAAFLAEAGLLGLAAGALGVFIGWMGAQGAVLGVARTMTALYGSSTATYASLSVTDLLFGVGLCVVTSLTAAWLPARTAASTPAAQVLGRHQSSASLRDQLGPEKLGAALCLAACGLAQLGPLRIQSLRLPLAAYTAALFWMLGAGLAASALLRCFSTSSNAIRQVAFSQFRRPSIRHRFAVAALTCATAMTTGMAVMIASFDTTMRGWINRSMQADIYLSSAGAQSASSTSSIHKETVNEIRAMPETLEAVVVHHTMARAEDGPVHVMGCDMAFSQRMNLQSWVQKPEMDWWKAKEKRVVINESLSERLQKNCGDTIAVPTPSGPRPATITGVFADYGNERGTIMLDQAMYQEWFKDDMAWRVAVMLKPGVDGESARHAIQASHPGLNVFTQAHLRNEALRIFRQTFAVTYSLEAVGVVVAVAGLGLALACLMLDRRPDLTVLRALGLTKREVALACAWEGFGLALGGVATGLVSGIWLGWLLIARVNKQSFGWTLSFHLPYGQLAALALAVIGAGVIVAASVGRWTSNLRADREE